ncbi:MAG: hypothetical protein EPO24_06835 [Bacteroidetes bacterium]|nr:MAG: hypothetical protein EPO24_06835 [Bacteroidota bacterium]
MSLNNEHQSKFYNEIIERLQSVRGKEHRLQMFYGALVTLLISFSAFLAAIILEQIFSFETTGRTLLAVIVSVVVLGATGVFSLRPLLRLLGLLKPEENHATAVKVGRHFPQIHDRLIDALQMYERKDLLRQLYSVALIDASFTDLYRQIQPLDFRDAISDSRLRKMRKIFLYGAALFMLVFVISPSGFLDSFYRLSHYSQSFAAPLPIQFTIEPGNVEVVRGETVPITIRTSGKPVTSIELLTRMEGQTEFDRQLLTRGTDGAFQAALDAIKNSTEYYASAEDISSGKFKISVLDRPLIRTFQFTVTPPAYTRIPVKVMDENTGDISVYPGTSLALKLLTSKEIASAGLLFSDSTSLPLNVEGTEANISFIAKQNRSYHFLLSDMNGLQNSDPIEYSLRMIPDEFPTVEVVQPGKHVDLNESMVVSLLVSIKDDFGFSKLRLAYRLAQSKFEQPSEEFSFIDLPLARLNQTSFDVPYQWNLSSLNLVPEDILAYYVEVFDNDNINGPKSGKSELFLARFPSLEEVFSDVSEQHQQSLESMQSVAKETEQLSKDIEQLQREMKKTNKNDWQMQKKADDMVKRYEAMKQRLEETSSKMNEMVNKMEENKLLTDKTLDKYLEMQKLLEQLRSPELMEALKKLQEKMKGQQLSQEEQQRAMEQLKANEDAFRKSLERMIELLKRIHIEQKIDELVKRTEEMLRQQEQLQQQTSQSKSNDKQKQQDLAKKQQDLQQQAEQLEKESSDLTEKMEEFPKEMPLNEMKKADQSLQQKNLPSKMQKSAEQMQSGEMQQSQASQEQSEKDMEEFLEQMKQVQKSLQSKQMQQIVNEMKKQLDNVLELSKRQEELKDDTKGLDPNSQRFRENTQQQSDILGDLTNVANAMGELGKKTFAVSPDMGKEIGKAMQQMSSSMEQMENRNPGGAGQNQNEAMGSLNRAAMQMQNALGGMMKGGKGGGGMGMAGLMSQLGQMAGGQGNVNKGTQDAMGMGGQAGMSSEQAAEYQRLGGQQAALQKSLEQLAQEAKNSGEFSKLLGDLDRVAQEMQEVQTDLVQGDVNPETLQKQERILSRLLDSQRSLREKDFEKRRRAEAGKNYDHASPADIDLTTQEGKNKLREELLKVLEGKYTKDYEDLIRKYFEQLEKEEIQ